MKALEEKQFIDEVYMALVDSAEDWLDENGWDTSKGIAHYYKEMVSYDVMSKLLVDKLIQRGFCLTKKLKQNEKTQLKNIQNQ